MKRAGGKVRHAVRVEALVLVAELGPQPFDSIRAAARAITERVPYAFETVRRALRDWTLEHELDLLVDHGNHRGNHEGTTEGTTEPAAANPQADASPPEPHPEAAPYSSTRPLSDGPDPGPMQPARPTHGRRPKEYRRSSYPGRCSVCSLDLDIGAAFYLTPYDTGTVTACLEHADLALAGAQMLYDVTRGRSVPEELELVIRPRPTR